MIPSRVLVPVSGGKDSQVCVALAVERFGREKVTMAHQNTGFDHPATYEHMRYMSERYGVPLIEVSNKKYKTVPDVIHGETMWPSRQARMCTRQLKTKPWFQWLAKQTDKATLLVYLGMRQQESPDRAARYADLANDDEFNMGDISGECPKGSALIRCSLPIVDWSVSRVFTFLRERDDKVNPLYARGHKRVGCYPCVLAGKRDFTLAARDPVGREHIIQLAAGMAYVKKMRPDVNVEQFFDHDLEAILAAKEDDPFGFFTKDEPEEDNAGGCSWCSM